MGIQHWPYPTSPYKGCLPPMSTLQKVAGSVHHRGSAERENKTCTLFHHPKGIAVKTDDPSGISWWDKVNYQHTIWLESSKEYNFCGFCGSRANLENFTLKKFYDTAPRPVPWPRKPHPLKYIGRWCYFKLWHSIDTFVLSTMLQPTRSSWSSLQDNTNSFSQLGS